MIILVKNILCKQEKESSLFNSIQYLSSAVCNFYANAYFIIIVTKNRVSTCSKSGGSDIFGNWPFPIDFLDKTLFCLFLNLCSQFPFLIANSLQFA